jgi:hypothetical protein
VDQHDREEALLRTAPDFDATAALRRMRGRVAAAGIEPRPSLLTGIAARLALRPGGWLRPAGAAAGVVLVATALAFTGLADTILTIFEPKQVVAIRVDPQDLRGVPDPTQYGTLTWIAQPSWHAVGDIDAASAEADFRPLVPASLPSGVPSVARWATMGQAKATFQFDEAKAKAAAARVNATIPPMPAAIANTTLTMTGGPAVMQQYGAAPNVPPDSAAWGGNPQLVLVQARAPLVTSNGATVQELRDYALAQPGIPPSVAAQIRAIGDPVATLLVPIGFDLQDARLVTVRGMRGYVVGDQTGLGSGVVWVEGGFVHLAFGSLREAELISLVNGLR